MLALGVAERPLARLCAPYGRGTCPVSPMSARARQEFRQTGPVAERDRTEVVLVLVVWVLPLLALVGLLVAADLAVIAGALLAVELLVAAAVVLARRLPAREAGTGRGWLAPVGIVLVLVALVGVALVAAQAG